MALEIVKKIECDNGMEDRTIKYLFKTKDNLIFESVLIFEEQLTLCASSQVGCIVNCTFCKTGEDKFKRNLTSEEIVSQVRLIEKDVGMTVDCVSYMGMGEPLLNLDNVIRSMKSLKKRYYKLSTIGVPGKIKKLARAKLPLELYFSLHAPNEDIRRKLIPISKTYKLEEIIEEINSVSKKIGKINLWYLMLKGVNDKEEHAVELAELLKKFKNIKFVILKKYCENYMGIQSSNPANVFMFNRILSLSGFSNYYSVSEGQQIKAGCGQLSQKYMKELNMDSQLNIK